ncbi:hypothetical protein HHI36_018192 [Cryptolaemus montrouzieri]|uniref:tRNA-queuosine alpha-mannosyltransferase n=1 Tax=Cryptolaemus montrouzieri TaxID=559131 RepID=A0ABD2P049_9CUCU
MSNDHDDLLQLSGNVCKKGRCPKVLMIEPFFGGSHKALIDIIGKKLSSYTLVTLKPKKWHWRARCSALCLMNIIPEITTEKFLFCSSVLNLAELLGIRPDLNKLKNIIYFHENQLDYPVQEIKQRDIQYPYNQIMSCLAADEIIFNSCYNKDIFLSNIKKVIKMIPDYRPKDLDLVIAEKSRVLYFPIEFPICCRKIYKENDKLCIAWPHRWEFDKGPDDFFKVLFKLKSDGFQFELVVLGEVFTEVPKIMQQAKEILKNEIIHFGHEEVKNDYFSALSNCHVAVSTSKHEYFGVAMLEAVYCGCFPLVPRRLVYPEIYPDKCLFSDLEELYKRLAEYCDSPQTAIKNRNDLDLNIEQYSAENLVPQFLKIFDDVGVE